MDHASALTNVAQLAAAGVRRGTMVGLVFGHLGSVAIASADHVWNFESPFAIAEIDQAIRPRWVMWSQETAIELVAARVRVSTSWDIAAVHRLLFGGFRAEPALAWARLNDLPLATIPEAGRLDFDGDGAADGDPEHPVRHDGHLRPDWAAGAWSDSASRLGAWATTALAAAVLQTRRLNELQADLDKQFATNRPIKANAPAHQPAGRYARTARSESTAELLCAELATDGLPIEIEAAHAAIASFIGPRPRNEREAAHQRHDRDQEVLKHAATGDTTDLRNPAQVKALLTRMGIDVPNTRAWVLEDLRLDSPLIDALLQWRKAERIATTYGYSWLNANVHPSSTPGWGRLRGEWTGSDGAAGRMTAQAGLHNLPVDLRSAVAAEPGFVLVRADLGQIEPRVLAAVSGDPAFARAAQQDDLYAPVATRLGVERAVAKVAVLGAMYGQTSGTGGQALRGLDSAYPVAMGYLRAAAISGRNGQDVRTFGGRLIRMWETPFNLSDAEERSVEASRGRFARNALVQGAAAELFKAWAVTVRARLGALDGAIVLCLHDELLLHVPEPNAGAAADLLHASLAEASYRYTEAAPVRFIAEVSIIGRWSEAKA